MNWLTRLFKRPDPEAHVKRGQVVTNGVIIGRVLKLEQNGGEVDAVIEYHDPETGQLTKLSWPADGRYELMIWQAREEEGKARGFLWRRGHRTLVNTFRVCDSSEGNSNAQEMAGTLTEGGQTCRFPSNSPQNHTGPGDR